MSTKFSRGFRALPTRRAINDHKVNRLGTAVRSVIETLENRTLLTASAWNNLSSSSAAWNTAANWTPSSSFPNSAADSANLNVNLAANQAITLNANITLDALTLGDSALTGGAGQTETINAGNTLTFDDGAGAATLTMGSNAVAGVTIAAPISLNGNLLITNNSSQTLTLSGNIDTKGHSITAAGSGKVAISGVISNSTGSGSLIQSGTGDLTLTANDTYTGGTTISSGRLGIFGAAAAARHGQRDGPLRRRILRPDQQLRGEEQLHHRW